MGIRGKLCHRPIRLWRTTAVQIEFASQSEYLVEEQSIEKPFDTKIEVGAGDRGEDVVTIPPAGIQLALLGPSAFLLFWLGGWVMGVVFASGAFISAKTPFPVRLFLGFWLCGWLVGGAFAWRALASMVVAMFGHEHISFDSEEVQYTRSAFGFNKTEHFLIQEVKQFDWKGDVPYHATNGALSTAGCTMWYGSSRIPMGHGVTSLEGEWLASELNRLLKGRKR